MSRINCHYHCHWLVLTVMAVLAAGCGGSGSLKNDTGMVAADYLVVDLVDGSAEPRRSIVASDPALRDRLMAFRRIPAADFVPGVVGSDLGEDDEKNRSRTRSGTAWLAVFELTRAQWQRLGGEAQPGAGDLPAVVMRGRLEQLLTSARGRGMKLDLPEAAVWEWASSAGTGAAYAWGESLLDADSSPAAVVDPLPGSTLASPTGPAVVGSKQASAWGLYDMHGNLWEHVLSDDVGHEIRGGSWAQGVIQARSSNRLRLGYDVEHPLVGARLVWEE